jgi:hypothetical protein
MKIDAKTLTQCTCFGNIDEISDKIWRYEYLANSLQASNGDVSVLNLRVNPQLQHATADLRIFTERGVVEKKNVDYDLHALFAVSLNQLIAATTADVN